jgi:hypothetical protein
VLAPSLCHNRPWPITRLPPLAHAPSPSLMAVIAVSTSIPSIRIRSVLVQQNNCLRRSKFGLFFCSLPAVPSGAFSASQLASLHSQGHAHVQRFCLRASPSE